MLNFGNSRISNGESELWNELAALHALDQDRAVAQRIPNLREGEAS